MGRKGDLADVCRESVDTMTSCYGPDSTAENSCPEVLNLDQASDQKEIRTQGHAGLSRWRYDAFRFLNSQSPFSIRKKKKRTRVGRNV